MKRQLLYVIISFILVSLILITSVADINHGYGAKIFRQAPRVLKNYDVLKCDLVLES